MKATGGMAPLNLELGARYGRTVDATPLHRGFGGPLIRSGRMWREETV